MVRFQTPFVPLAFAFAASLTGCASSGVGRTDSTTESMAGLENFLTDSKETVSTALTSLDDVSKTANSDPRPAYQTFCKDVEKIEAAAETARSRSIAMKTRAKEHHDKWLQELAQIENPEMRKASEDRRQKALASFEALETQMGDVKSSYEPFIGLMKDIRAFLANDLSPGGIASMKGQSQQAAQRGHDVESKIDRLVGEIAKVRKEWEVSRPSPQPASSSR